jgi:uncharacterized protein YecT (DUF1311 family)
MSEYLAQQTEYADDPPARRTAAEIADLKAQWLNDPCWDIETTEGFEAHYQELRAWRETRDEECRALELERVSARGAHLGFSYEQMRLIESLERRIRALERVQNERGEE